MTIPLTGSLFRQIVAVLVSVYGVLSATSVLNHLPVAVSVVLSAVGPLVVGLQQWLDHPSTGTPTMPVQTAQGVVHVPVAPQPAPPPTTP
jgi:hypothetical protein